MQDNNLNILKQFSRKLANCKYRVPVDKLCQYFNEGQFGYTTIKGSDTVVTNDFVFADDISTAIKHIRAIFSEPHISLRQENVIKNASMSSNVDARALSSTIKDEKLWKVNGNSIRPEYVHAYVQEDNLAIYENRFISFLIDTLFNVANEKLGSLCDNIKNINSEMKSAFPLSEGNDYSVNDYVDFLDYNNGLPVLLSSTDITVKIISSLVKSKKILASLKNNTQRLG